MSVKKKWWLWLLAALVLVYFLSAFVTRCSREQADFVSVMVVTTEREETPAEKLDTWIAGSLHYRFWQYMATPADQRQAELEAMESYEMENGMIE